MATTITVEDETLERFNQLKQRAGDDNLPELSANHFLQSLMDTWEAVDEGHYDTTQEVLAALENVDGVNRTLDGNVDLSPVITEIQQVLEQQEHLNGRLDDLESRIPKRTAEELR